MLELRVPTTRALRSSDLSGIDLFVSPRAGSVSVALAVLSAGIPLVAFDGGELSEVLRASGLEALVLAEGESPVSARERAECTLRASSDRGRSGLALSAERAAETFLAESSSLDLPPRAPLAEAEANDLVVELDDGLSIVVPATLDNISTFVLLEQRRWFEDEVDFVDALLRPGDVVLDVGANHGVYALPMARKVGPDGRVLAFEPARDTARRLRKSAALNALPALEIEQKALGEHPGTATLAHGRSPELHQIGTGPGEPVEVKRLDDYRHVLGGLRFVKLDAEGFEEPILRGGAALLESEQPLVMFELKHGSEINHALIERFRELGFASYTLVPALDALVRLDLEALDGFQLNLFAATRERAIELAGRGLLFDGELPSRLSPDLAAAGAWLGVRPYARAFAAEPTTLMAWQIMAEDRKRTLGERRAAQLAALKLAVGDPARAALPELLTRARILRGAGRRSEALLCLAEARDRLLREHSVAAPMLPVLARYEQLESESFHEWLEAQSLEASVRFQAFSSFFAGDEPMPWLLRLLELPSCADEMLRRLSLVLERRGRLD
jgi:FkbM family methyltransferase